jgi:hypothetical protein
MKLLETAPPPRDHQRLSGTLGDGRVFVISFQEDRTAVVPEEVADMVVPLSGGSIHVVRDALEDEKSDCAFVDMKAKAREASMQRPAQPFPDKLDILNMPELRPRYPKVDKEPQAVGAEKAEELVPAVKSRANRKK